MPGRGGTDDGRRLRGPALAGAVVALVLDALMLSAGHADPLRNPGPLGGFFDAQGHALLHGHLTVDPSKVGFEGFLERGGVYIYYGVVPALLRLPVLAVTHRLDGRLTALSMLMALAVLLAASHWLHMGVRRLVRPGAPVTAGDRVAAFWVPVVVGVGTVVLYLMARLAVYNEVELWGTAWSVATVAAIVGLIGRPGVRRALVAGLLATLAVNTRVSVGLGPVAALGLLTVVVAAAPLLPRLGALGRGLASLGPAPVEAGRRGLVLALAAATLVPLVSSAAINEAKFRTPFGIPLDKQTDVAIDRARRHALAANDGSLFGVKFVPTTLLAAVRPDAVGSFRAFPFVGLPRRAPTVVGDVVFDDLEPSLSATTSMPLVCLLAVIGLVVALRRRALRPLAGVTVATAVGFAGALTLAYTNTRYLADVLPCLLLAALVGLEALLARLAARPPGTVAAVALAVGLTLLGLFGLVVDAGAGVTTQRLLNPETTEADRASFVHFEDAVDRFIAAQPAGIHRGAALPARAAPLGDLFVVGHCAGLYVAGLGGVWQPVERTAATGLYRLRVRPAALAGRGTRPLLVVGRGPRRVSVLGAIRGNRLELSVRARAGRPVPVAARTVAPDRPVTVEASADTFLESHVLTLFVDGRRLGAPPVPAAPGPGAVVRRPARPLRDDAPVCRRVAGRAGLLAPTLPRR